MQQPIDQSVGQRKDIPGQYLDIALIPGILPWLQGNIRYITLQWPLICPRKVLHSWLYIFNYFPHILINDSHSFYLARLQNLATL